VCPLLPTNIQIKAHIISASIMADTKTYEIPRTCKAGVVSNEGPDFKLKVEDIPVPEPGKYIVY
jgi:hypothetical protein